MTVDTALTISAGRVYAPSIPTSRPLFSVDLAISQWLAAKQQRTQSERTKETYEMTLHEFRAALQSQGLDLDSVATQDDKARMQLARDQVKQIAHLPMSRWHTCKHSSTSSRLRMQRSYHTTGLGEISQGFFVT